MAWSCNLVNGSSLAQLDVSTGGPTCSKFLATGVNATGAQVVRTEDIHKSWGPAHVNGG